jgi:thiamine transporter
MKKTQVRDLAFMAMYAALYVVLDMLHTYLGAFKMPQGGSLGVGTIVLLLASYHLGWKKGTIVAVITVLVGFAYGSVTYYGIVSFLLDYLLGYAVYGLACLIPNHKYFFPGIIVVTLVRFVFSTISGMIVWETPLWGSMVYQASYLGPTLLLDIIMVPLLFKALQPIIAKK